MARHDPASPPNSTRLWSAIGGFGAVLLVIAFAVVALTQSPALSTAASRHADAITADLAPSRPAPTKAPWTDEAEQPVKIDLYEGGAHQPDDEVEVEVEPQTTAPNARKLLRAGQIRPASQR
jgi:hypothetical protein